MNTAVLLLFVVALFIVSVLIVLFIRAVGRDRQADAALDKQEPGRPDRDDDYYH